MFRCFEWAQFGITKRCPFPGIDVEILYSIARFLNYTIVSEMKPEKRNPDESHMSYRGAYDVMSNMLTSGQAPVNMSTTQPVMYQTYAVLSGRDPVSVEADIWNLLSPFDWPVWIALLVLSAVNAGYTFLFTLRKHVAMDIATCRASFKPSLLPVTLGTHYELTLHQRTAYQAPVEGIKVSHGKL